MIQTITSGNVTAKINTFGGELTSLTKDGKEYIWQGDPASWKDQAPILFPIVGKSRNGMLRIKGKDYPMGSHGFVRRMELEVTEQTEDSVTLSLTQNEETKKHYPWDFAFSVRFSLDASKLTCSLLVENTDKEPIIFGLGGHPGFNVPLNAGECFEDYQLEFEKEEVLKSNRISDEIEILKTKDLILESGRVLPLKHDQFNNDAMIFEDIESRWVKLVHKDTKAGIHFSYEDFPVLAVWTTDEAHAAPFVCLEPWIGMGFREGESTDIQERYGLQTLQPKEKFAASFSAEIID